PLIILILGLMVCAKPELPNKLMRPLNADMPLWCKMNVDVFFQRANGIFWECHLPMVMMLFHGWQINLGLTEKLAQLAVHRLQSGRWPYPRLIILHMRPWYHRGLAQVLER